MFVLNIAGPRESSSAGIYALARNTLERILPEAAQFENAQVTPDTYHLELWKEGLASLRHWDTIRWIVPFWYYTATGTALAAIQQFTSSGVVALAFLLAICGTLSALLIGKTIRYHNEQVDQLRSIMIPIDFQRMSTIKFSFQGKNTPATVWFYLSIVFIAAFWFSLGFSSLLS